MFLEQKEDVKRVEVVKKLNHPKHLKNKEPMSLSKLSPKNHSSNTDFCRTIILVRHGESIGNACKNYGLTRKDPKLLDCGLTPKGESQADNIRYYLSKQGLDQNIDLICTSPLTRAIETAARGFSFWWCVKNKEVGKGENATPSPPIICHPALKERGEKLPENRARQIKDVKKDLRKKYSRRDPHVTNFINNIDFSLLPENWPNMNQKLRVEDFIDWIQNSEEHSDKKVVVVVCHFCIIQLLVSQEIRGYLRIINGIPIVCTLNQSDTHLNVL